MIIGYVRVSTGGQNVENQKLSILEYCNREKISVDDWISVQASTRKDSTVRRIDELMAMMKDGDTVIVSELSRLGRSVGQIVILVKAMVDSGVGLICLKENIRIGGKMDIQSKVMVTLFGLMAEIERDLISERTREGLARAKAEGKIVGRPRGAYSSKLDGFSDEIIKKYSDYVPLTRIAKDYSTTPGNLRSWLRKKGVKRGNKNQ
jgi:DNA invertase Pin-like site-specific DNA recombinase